CLSEPPARVTSVGYQSTTCIGSLTTVPGLILPCQQANAGTRTPPSYSVDLPPRSGTLLATLSGLTPPLSLEERNRVSFVSFFLSMASTICPTASSSAATMPAKVRRSPFSDTYGLLYFSGT